MRKQSPVLPKPRQFPEVPGSPSIRLVVRDHTDAPRAVAKTLRYARNKFSYLADATKATQDPDYTIDLSVTNQHRWVNAELAGYSYMMIPSWINQKVVVVAAVTTGDGRSLGTFRSIGKCTLVTQLHLAYIFPITAPFVPLTEQKMWRNTFRDTFIQAGNAIAADKAAKQQLSTVFWRMR